MTIRLSDISIRHDLRPGDLGMIIHLHGRIYAEENGYGLELETYVIRGLLEFYDHFDTTLDRIWICEHQQRMVGMLALQHRPERSAQLRYFLIQKSCRGIGLGSLLMEQFMAFFHQCRYQAAYLWTTCEQMAAIRLYQRHGFRLSEEKPSTAFGKALIERRYDFRIDPL